MNRHSIKTLMFGLMLPATAAAMPSFPGQIQQHLGLSYTPGCILCHGSNQGGGPVSQPFGQAMLAAGLTSAGGDSLNAALDKLAADGTDSNGDGIADIEGLKGGTAPTANKPPVEYGCGGGQIAPRGPMGWPASSLSLMTFVLLSYRALRRKRHFTLCKERRHTSRV
jgi:hypothetical protein